MTKKCNKCGEIKSLSAFSASRGHAVKRQSTCKACVVICNKAYYRTIPGLINQMYNRQKRNSKERNHPMPEYTQDVLAKWLLANGLEELHKQWKNAEYAIRLKPSVDRLNSTKPYTLETIRLVTWEENNEAAYAERKSGKRITRQNRRVQQLTLAGAPIAEYPSISNAARTTGFCRTNINGCLRGMRDMAHGFRWKYLENAVPNEPTSRDVTIKAEALKRKEKI